MTEVIVYQACNSAAAQTVSYTAEQRQAAYNLAVIPPQSRVVGTGVFALAGKIFGGLSLALAVLGTSLILISFAPGAITWVKAQASPPASNYQLTQTEVKLLTVTKDTRERTYMPTFDSRLPVINHLTISSIGVDTDIQEATYTNYEEALKKGVWRVSDFGAPNEDGSPVILAAHRYGYLAWTNTFRHKNSFYNLPNVKPGDTVSIIWRQRKYTYEVYATDKGTEIKDYTADLILYTCETLTGPGRIFVYARLLQSPL